MKYIKSIYPALILGMLPAMVLAAGQHAGGHGHDDTTAYGEPGDAARVTRTVVVEAADNMRYTPDAITVKRGETIKFVVKNTGKIPHELVLGDAKSLKEHAEVMRKYPDMEHDDPNATKVAPGGTGTLIWKFTQAGTVEFACLIAGHYEAGMKGSIRVGTK